MNNSSTGTYIHYNQLLEIAEGAARTARSSVQSDRECTSSTPLVAIVFSAAACETFINEVVSSARLAPNKNEHAEEFAHIMESLEDSRANIKIKFMLAKRILCGRAYRKGEQPFQDFALLENVRNHVMHGKLSELKFKQGTAGFPTEDLHPSLKKMESLNILAEFPGATNVVAGSVLRLSTPAVAAWAHRSARRIIDDLVDSIPAEWGTAIVQVRELARHSNVGVVRDIRTSD